MRKQSQSTEASGSNGLVSLTELAHAKRKRAGRPKGSGFSAELSVRIAVDPVTCDRLLFTLHDALMVRAGLQKGDAVDVMFDASAQRGVIFKRDGGYSFWKSRSDSNSRVLIPFVAESGFPQFKNQTALKVIDVKEGMIAFFIPDRKDETAKASDFLHRIAQTRP